MTSKYYTSAPYLLQRSYRLSGVSDTVLERKNSESQITEIKISFSRNTDISKKDALLNTPALALERQQQQQQQSLFVPQKLYSVDINTRKKKNYKGKKHSHLEIA